MSSYRWPEELWAQAKALIESGKNLKETALLIGCERQALKSKVCWERATSDVKIKRNEASRRRRFHDKAKTPPRLQLERQFASSKPSPELIAERDYRLSIAPRDLTAALQGDPLPGFSALERRV